MILRDVTLMNWKSSERKHPSYAFSLETLTESGGGCIHPLLGHLEEGSGSRPRRLIHKPLTLWLGLAETPAILAWGFGTHLSTEVPSGTPERIPGVWGISNRTLPSFWTSPREETVPASLGFALLSHKPYTFVLNKSEVVVGSGWWNGRLKQPWRKEIWHDGSKSP